MVHLLKWYRFTTLHILISTVIALLVSWAFLAYVIWTKPNEVIVHDPPTAEDIAKATAPIIAERDAQSKSATPLAKNSTLLNKNSPLLNKNSTLLVVASFPHQPF